MILKQIQYRPGFIPGFFESFQIKIGAAIIAESFDNFLIKRQRCK